MPRWLQLWITATLFVVWSAFVLVGVPLAMGLATHAGQKAFSENDRNWLSQNVPSGHFVSDSDYVDCENRVWVHYDSSHRTYTLAGEDGCWQ